MKPAAVLYATHDGQTRKIAAFVAETLNRRGQVVETLELSSLGRDFDLSRFGPVIVAAPVRAGKYHSDALRFMRNHCAALQRMHAVFLSVCLAQATMDDPAYSPEFRSKAEAEMRGLLQHLRAATGWPPDRVWSVAGALPYTKYNFLVRFMMKRITRQHGGPTDTSRDYEFTRWDALEQATTKFAEASAS